MGDRRNDHSQLESVEAMLLAAGDYVRASDDLRPRVLEAARAQRAEQSTRRSLRGAAGTLVVCAGLAALIGSGANREPGARRKVALVPVDSQAMFVRAQAMAASSGGLAWGIVDAFRELRQEQSAAIRSDL